jgi:hypothetical protein
MSDGTTDDVDAEAEAERLYKQMREHIGFPKGYPTSYAEAKRFKEQLRAEIVRIVAAARATKPR